MMAWLFKKKHELEFPQEEKEEVLKEIPIEPPKPKARFEEGFKKPEELRPSVPTSLPPFERPEPIPTPAPKPKPVAVKPHIYVKIEKYQEVMNAVAEIGKQIEETRKELESIEEMNIREKAKIEEAKAVLNKMKELINVLNGIFVEPE